MRYPHVREELLGYLNALSDVSYQRSCWVEHDCPSGIEHDELDYAVHFLFDETTLATDPESWINLCLNDFREAEMIQCVCTNLNDIFDKYGDDLYDAEYIAVPEWGSVVVAAKLALSVCAAR